MQPQKSSQDNSQSLTYRYMDVELVSEIATIFVRILQTWLRAEIYVQRINIQDDVQTPLIPLRRIFGWVPGCDIKTSCDHSARQSKKLRRQPSQKDSSLQRTISALEMIRDILCIVAQPRAVFVHCARASDVRSPLPVSTSRASLRYTEP